jgi:hypothetical protein
VIYLAQAIRLLLAQVAWRPRLSWRPNPRLGRLLLSFWLWFAALIALGFYSATVPVEQADVAYTALGTVAIVTIALLVRRIVGRVSGCLRQARQPRGMR